MRSAAVLTRPAAGPARALPWLALVREPIVWLAALTLLGFGLRVAWVLHQDYFPLGGDGRWYLVVARNISEGRGYVIGWDGEGHEMTGLGQPTAFWPPVYPLMLAGAFKVFGISMTAAKLLNAALGALAIPLVFLLGRAVFDRRTALLGAAIFAFLPEPVLSVPVVLSEFPFTVLLLGALVVLVAAPPSRHRWLATLLFGLLAGLAVLTRGPGLVLVPVALLFWWQRDGFRAASRSALLLALGLAITVGPWTLRNALVLDAPVTFATSAGVNLRIGHGPDADGTYVYPDEIQPSDGWNTLYHAMQPDEEVGRNDEYTRRAIEYARTHPQRELQLAGAKLAWLFRADPDDLLRQLETLGTVPIEPAALRAALPPLVYVSHYGLLALAAIALPLWFRVRDPKTCLLVSTVALYALFHVAFFGLPRYHLPILPLFALSAAWLLVRLWDVRDHSGSAGSTRP